MFNKLVAIILIISLQSVSFAMLLVDAGFKLNENYIIEKLCINKAKPQLKCQGKCYLKKMQQKAAQQKEKQENQNKEIQFQQLFYNQVTLIAFYSQFTNLFQVPSNNNNCFQGWPEKTFHPPGLV